MRRASAVIEGARMDRKKENVYCTYVLKRARFAPPWSRSGDCVSSNRSRSCGTYLICQMPEDSYVRVRTWLAIDTYVRARLVGAAAGLPNLLRLQTLLHRRRLLMISQGRPPPPRTNGPTDGHESAIRGNIRPSVMDVALDGRSEWSEKRDTFCGGGDFFL